MAKRWTIMKFSPDLPIWLSLPDKSDRGFEREFTDGRTAEEWLRVLYDESRARGHARGFALPEYEKFLEAGFLRLELPQTPVTLLEKFRQNPKSHPLKTPSGLIEIFSETIAGFGIEDNPGHPVWNEPSEWLGAKKTKSFPMHLISHQPERRLHSQLDDSAHSRAGKIEGREPCRLNPQGRPAPKHLCRRLRQDFPTIAALSSASHLSIPTSVRVC